MYDSIGFARLARATTVTVGGQAQNAVGWGEVVQQVRESFLVEVHPSGGGETRRFVVPKASGGVWVMPPQMGLLETFEVHGGRVRTKPIAGTGGDAIEASGSDQ